MGRIKTREIRVIAERVLEERADNISKDFEQNKVLLREHEPELSVWVRNRVAGYLTRFAKRKESALPK